MTDDIHFAEDTLDNERGSCSCKSYLHTMLKLKKEKQIEVAISIYTITSEGLNTQLISLNYMEFIAEIEVSNPLICQVHCEFQNSWKIFYYQKLD